MIGRRPNRSESAPIMGAQRNCMSEYVAPITPTYRPANVVLPPTNSFTSSGSTGIMMPIPRMSRNRVIRIKASAARGLSWTVVTATPSKVLRPSEHGCRFQESLAICVRLEEIWKFPRHILTSWPPHRIVGLALPVRLVDEGTCAKMAGEDAGSTRPFEMPWRNRYPLVGVKGAILCRCCPPVFRTLTRRHARCEYLCGCGILPQYVGALRRRHTVFDLFFALRYCRLRISKGRDPGLGVTLS